MAGTCIVACKLPSGLHAELIDMDDAHASQVKQGGDVKMIRPVLGRVFFRGSAAQRQLERADDKGNPGAAMESIASVASGFGLTVVDADFAKAWFDQNRNYPPVAKGLIFMSAKADGSAAAQAKDQSEVKNGFEPINPHAPAPGIVPVKAAA